MCQQERGADALQASAGAQAPGPAEAMGGLHLQHTALGSSHSQHRGKAAGCVTKYPPCPSSALSRRQDSPCATYQVHFLIFNSVKKKKIEKNNTPPLPKLREFIQCFVLFGQVCKEHLLLNTSQENAVLFSRTDLI